MIIYNNTKHVVIVKNRSFLKEIAIGDSVSINKEEIRDDFEFEFSYFSFKRETHRGQFDIRLKEFGHYSESEIPITTKTNVEGCEKLFLRDDTRYFLFTSWTSRTTSLIVIKAVWEGSKKNKNFLFFTNPSDKRLFLIRMVFQSIITLAITILLFQNILSFSPETWREYIFPIVVALSFFASGFRKLCYFFAAIFWKSNGKN